MRYLEEAGHHGEPMEAAASRGANRVSEAVRQRREPVSVTLLELEA